MVIVNIWRAFIWFFQLSMKIKEVLRRKWWLPVLLTPINSLCIFQWGSEHVVLSTVRQWNLKTLGKVTFNMVSDLQLYFNSKLRITEFFNILVFLRVNLLSVPFYSMPVLTSFHTKKQIFGCFRCSFQTAWKLIDCCWNFQLRLSC